MCLRKRLCQLVLLFKRDQYSKIHIMFYKKHFFLFLIILISAVPLIDLFKSGLPLTHDGQDHVARIANFYQNLSEGNIIPRWAGNLNWGYGHPILEFLYPLLSYLASFFHFFGFTFVDSVKLLKNCSVMIKQRFSQARFT